MAGSLNKVTLIGNLGKDPEIRFMPDGSKVASFSLATSDVWKDKTTGERKERTEWHRAVVFNERLADIVEKYVRKGSKLYVEGALQTRKWTDQSGAERYVTEVVLGKFRGDIVILDPKKSDAGSFDDQSYGAASSSSDVPADDDIPF